MNEKNHKGHLAMLTANIVWGLNAPIGKAVLDSGITALSLTSFRMVGGAVAFWICSFFGKKEQISHKDMFLLFFAALFGVVLNQGSFIFGLSLTSPIDASIITTITPIIAMIIAAVYLKEPITGKKILGILVGASGALLLILSSQSAVISQKDSSVLGNILCLSAQCSFALYLVLFKNLIGKYSIFTTMKWMFTYACVCFLPFSYKDLTTLSFAEITPATYTGIFFVVLGATFFSYICVAIGQKTLRPTLISMYNYVQPIVASIIAVLIGMSSFGWSKAGAIVLVFTGVYVVTQSKSKEQVERENSSMNKKP